MKRLFTALALVLALAAPLAPAHAADGKTLVVATNATFPPLEFVDMNKEIVGYDMDIIKAIAEEAGFEVKFMNTSWDGIFATLDSDNCDIIAAGVTITPEREKRYLFSEPYYKMRQAVVVPLKSDITKMDDLAGKRVGAQIGTTGVFVAEAVSQLIGGLACILTMYFTVYRPLRHLPDAPLQPEGGKEAVP